MLGGLILGAEQLYGGGVGYAALLAVQEVEIKLPGRDIPDPFMITEEPFFRGAVQGAMGTVGIPVGQEGGERAIDVVQARERPPVDGVHPAVLDGTESPFNFTTRGCDIRPAMGEHDPDRGADELQLQVVITLPVIDTMTISS